MTPGASAMDCVARELLGEPNPHHGKPGELRYGTRGSLSVDVGNGRWFDHERRIGGGVLELIIRERGGTKAEARRWLKERGSYTRPDPAIIAQRRAGERARAGKKSRQALAVLHETWPIGGTLAETYLRGRGINCELPCSLRFAPDCWHGPSARRYPAMVAMIEGSGMAAIHRTYLRPDGSGKADIVPDKMMLGAAAGGAVRLTQGPGPLVVGEGVETGLSLASGLLRAPATVWAALSTSGLRGLHLPPQPGRLTIATDGDDAGRNAGHDLAERAHGLGWAVSLLPAPDRRDWNDILTMKGVAA